MQSVADSEVGRKFVRQSDIHRSNNRSIEGSSSRDSEERRTMHTHQISASKDENERQDRDGEHRVDNVPIQMRGEEHQHDKEEKAKTMHMKDVVDEQNFTASRSLKSRGSLFSRQSIGSRGSRRSGSYYEPMRYVA